MLERNPDYWQGPADVSRVTFRFIPEFSARMAALLSGEIDIMKDVPPHAVEAVERSGRARAALDGVLAHQLPGAGESQARADAGSSGCAGP